MKAELHLPPPAGVKGRDAVSVPASALLYHLGRPLVYLRREAEKDAKNVVFARHEVQVLGCAQDRWILAADQELFDQASVVVRNAQRLLSQEFAKAGDDD